MTIKRSGDSSRGAQTEDEEDQEQNPEEHREEFGDRERGPRDPGEPEQNRDKADQEESQCELKHQPPPGWVLRKLCPAPGAPGTSLADSCSQAEPPFRSRPRSF